MIFWWSNRLVRDYLFSSLPGGVDTPGVLSFLPYSSNSSESDQGCTPSSFTHSPAHCNPSQIHVGAFFEEYFLLIFILCSPSS